MSFNLVRLSQRDPRWANDKLGLSSYTLGTSGCAVSSVAMLLSGWGYLETPASLNEKLKQRGGFMGASIVWGAVGTIFPNVKYKNLLITTDADAPIDQIDMSLAVGQPVLLQVDSSPEPGLQTHWVVAYQKNGADFFILDPYPYPTEDGKDISLMGRYSQGKSLARAISAIVWYDGISAGAAPAPASVSLSGYLVRVVAGLASGLRLRSQPSILSNTLALEPSGSLLQVLEPESTARPKLGVYDQWLRVRDGAGLEGYIAAWYVENTASPTPVSPVPAVPPGSPAPVTLTPLGQQVANVPLEPNQKISPAASATSTQRRAAEIWNTFGGVLSALAQTLKVDVAAAVAVLAVESGGQGFGPDGRMIIRFENHVFYTYWGQKNQAQFDQHFLFNPSQRWTGHKWRPSVSESWRPVSAVDFHGVQANEWDVLTFARVFDDTAAKMSISMGLPQIMGFNHAAIGYPTVHAMFDAFASGERNQIVGMFDFIKSTGSGLSALQSRDFVKFAGAYNGSGQAVMYGSLIKSSFDAFNGIAKGIDLTPPAPVVLPPVNLPVEPTPPAPGPVNLPEEPAPTPVPAPPDLFVYVVSEVGSRGLIIRQTSSDNARQVGSAAAGEALMALVEADALQKRIGVNGKWIKVRARGGVEGFAAAWLLTLTSPLGQPAPVAPPVVAPPLVPTPIPAGGLTVVVLSTVGAGGLRLRAQASQLAALVAVLPAGTSLSVLDAPEVARPKIGQVSAWLWVKDAQGRQGYVAAWYVAEARDADSTETLSVIVSSLASGSGLRLRALPNASAEIIKTLAVGATLTVLEPRETAEKRVGVFNEWLNVRDLSGSEGFVAAWYVQK